MVDPVRAVGPLPRDIHLRRALVVSDGDEFFDSFPASLARWQSVSPQDFSNFVASSPYREGGAPGRVVLIPAGVSETGARAAEVKAMVSSLGAFLHPMPVEAVWLRALGPANVRMFPTTKSADGRCAESATPPLGACGHTLTHRARGVKCVVSTLRQQVATASGAPGGRGNEARTRRRLPDVVCHVDGHLHTVRAVGVSESSARARLHATPVTPRCLPCSHVHVPPVTLPDPQRAQRCCSTAPPRSRRRSKHRGSDQAAC